MNIREYKLKQALQILEKIKKERKKYEERLKNSFIGTQVSIKLNKNKIIYFSAMKNLTETKIALRIYALYENGKYIYFSNEKIKYFDLPINFKKLNKFLGKVLKHKLDTKGMIYLVTDGEYTKIGATSYNIQKRLNELQTGNARKLHLLGCYPVENKISTESFLHSLYKEKHILGEWFKLDNQDIKNILNAKYDEISEDFITLKELEKQWKQIEKEIEPIVKQEQLLLLNRYLNKTFLLDIELERACKYAFYKKNEINKFINSICMGINAS